MKEGRVVEVVEGFFILARKIVKLKKSKVQRMEEVVKKNADTTVLALALVDNHSKLVR